MDRVCIAGKRVQGLNLNIRGTTEERHRINNVRDKSHARGIKNNNNFKKPIGCAQLCTSGVTSDSLGARLQALSQGWNAGYSFVCSLHIYVNICKADFVPYKLL